ncbi:HAD-IA family hydrolase [uncultured Algoriphagus sp.]|uniref:HAD family hydrolase n=1 Tax=uncultured Algoriphagus sp. TaxID=417365 RepID=UPI0030EF64DF|tara:strand:+ start:2575 stop:3186 length:612 start_codon:yes stop_codon:yes gene_type:complete
MENSQTRVIFFDIGGVLLSNGWGHLSREKAAKKFNLNYEEMNVLHNFIFNVFEIGSITLDDYLETVVFNHSRDFSKEEFKNFMFSQSVELPDMLPWLKEWKKNCGVRVFSINNESRELNDYRIKKFSLHQCFDGFFSSCHLGMRKPDPGIFQLAMGIAQARPEECAYFDDRLMLAEAGEKLGIRSFHHRDFKNTLENLMNLKK